MNYSQKSLNFYIKTRGRTMHNLVGKDWVDFKILWAKTFSKELRSNKQEEHFVDGEKIVI